MCLDVFDDPAAENPPLRWYAFDGVTSLGPFANTTPVARQWQKTISNSVGGFIVLYVYSSSFEGVSVDDSGDGSSVLAGSGGLRTIVMSRSSKRSFPENLSIDAMW